MMAPHSRFLFSFNTPATDVQKPAPSLKVPRSPASPKESTRIQVPQGPASPKRPTTRQSQFVLSVHVSHIPIQATWSDIAEAFQRIDINGDGVTSVPDLLELLGQFSEVCEE